MSIFLNDSPIRFTFKDKKRVGDLLETTVLPKLSANFKKKFSVFFSYFHKINNQICLFNPICSGWLVAQAPILLTNLLSIKSGPILPPVAMKVSWNIIFAFFCQFKTICLKKAFIFDIIWFSFAKKHLLMFYDNWIFNEPRNDSRDKRNFSFIVEFCEEKNSHCFFCLFLFFLQFFSKQFQKSFFFN